MFSLIETIIGFSVIMLLLSILVKSMTSVVKNHVDYYSKNLKREVERLVYGTIGKSWSTCENEVLWLKSIQWRRLGEEYMNKENMEWLLTKLGATSDKFENLEARLEVHKANIRYTFAKRTNNISLVLGLGLCLFMNINAFTIWDTLYNDQQARAKFSSGEYLSSAQSLIKENEDRLEGNTKASAEELRKELEEATRSASRTDPPFTSGRILRNRQDMEGEG